MKASTALLHMFVLLHVSAPFLPAALQEKTEHAMALRNRNFVETLETKEIGIARRLVEGLALLRQGKPLAALAKLSPTLLPGSPSYQIKYGERETRNFHELLLDLLEHAPPAVRSRFLERMNVDAARTFLTLRGDHEGLAEFLRVFPGTRSAARARLELVDAELEAGDWVAASVHMQRLTAKERKAREATLNVLATADLAVD